MPAAFLGGHGDDARRVPAELEAHAAAGGGPQAEAGAAAAHLRSADLSIADTGPGIPEADAAHVFDRFYQTDTGRSRGGTGLGLAFCKLAVELHGGKIGVANGGQPGAIVEFTIPAATRAAPDLPAVTA